MISVKIIRIPGAVTNVTLQDGSTVADAMQVSNTQVGEGEALQVNGIDAGLHTPLNSGDRIVISKGAKGAMNIQDVTYIDSIPADGLTDGQIFDKIHQLKAEKKHLKDLDVQGPAVDAAKKKINADIKRLTEIVNARYPENGDE